MQASLRWQDVQSPFSAAVSEAGTDIVEKPSEPKAETSSPATGSAAMKVALTDVTTLLSEKVNVEGNAFDPAHPQLRSVLLEKLGFAETALIQKLEGDQGAFNEGVWTMTDTHTAGVVLKLVPHHRLQPWRATDAERYENIQKWCPKITQEYSLCYPLKIFELQSSNGTCKDLLVMRRAQGAQMTHHLFHKFHSGSLSTLANIFKDFGTFLSVIHRVYRGAQHGDCHPSNVFYDEVSGHFTLIDVADFGFGPFLAEGGENDVERFVAALKTLTQWYGEEVIANCETHFRAGYAEQQAKNACSQ